MLTETELHYICGFLYLRVRRTDINVVSDYAMLGEKVYDDSAEEERDVDIVVATAGQSALIGVEVKDEGRPLDVTKVEQICQKLIDMPLIQEKYLISSSGFTAPARKKAKAHGLGCLRLVRGPVPRLGNIDLSQLSSFKSITYSWSVNPQPHITFEPGVALPSEIAEGLTKTTPVLLPDGSIIDVIELSKRVLLRSIDVSQMKNDNDGTSEDSFHHRVLVNLEDKPQLMISEKTHSVSTILIEGMIVPTVEMIPLYDSVYLESEDDGIFAAAIIIEYQDGLFGLEVVNDNTLYGFRLPPELRKKRPLQHKLT